MKTTRISVRLDRGLRASIRKRAKAAGRREGEMIREALQREFQEQPAQKSSYDVAVALGLIGCVEGAPRDLSSEPRHMDSAHSGRPLITSPNNRRPRHKPRR